MNDEIVSIVEERAPIETTITVDYIEVEAPKPAEIELNEAFPPIGEANEQLNHTLLHNRDSADQHPIVAITGLREELDEIESLKSVYADKVNVANYYKWNTGAYDTAGFFVSLVPHSTTIKICDGADIFGVTVDSAGFIGGQNAEIPRDNSYALVATSGLVDVRCESTVAEGDYVISNAQGMAEKTTSSCGYKVIAVNDDRTHDPGVLYATIALGVQACTTDAISKKVQHIEERVDNNEINIAAAMNVANQAYNKAQESMAAGQIMGDQVSDALGKVEDMEADVENMGTQVGNIATITAQAKAIAESAATSAESMKNEAVEKANEALADTSELREEMIKQSIDMQTGLDNAALQLQATKEELQGICNNLQGSIDEVSAEISNTKLELENTRNELQTGIDNMSNELNSTKTDLENARNELQSEIDTTKAELTNVQKELQSNIDKTMEDLEATKGDLANIQQELQDNIDEIAQSVDDTKTALNDTKTELNQSIENATNDIAALAEDMEPLISWSDDEKSGVAGFVARADENAITIANIVTLQGETSESLAGFKQEVSDTYATIESVTKLKSETTEAIAGVQQKATETYATIESVTKLQTETSNAIAGVKQEATETYATIESLTALETETSNAIAGVRQEANEKYATVESIASLRTETSDAIAGVRQEVSDTYATIESVTKLETDTIKSIALIKQEATETYATIASVAQLETDTSTAIAGVKQEASEKYATVESVATLKTDTTNAVSGLRQEVSDTYATIESITSLKSETSEAIAGVKQETSETYATIESVTSLETETSEAITGVKQEVADTYATIDSFTALETQTSEAIAGVKQEASETYATIESVATLETNTSSAISTVKQTADNNKAQLDAVSSFTYTDEDGNTSTGLAGLKSQVTDNAAELSTVANYETDDTKGLAGLVAQVDKNKSDIALLSQFGDDTGEGLAGLVAQVGANTAELETIASHTYTDADGNVLKGLAAINQQVTDQGAEIDSIVSWQGTTNTTIAGIEQKANDNAGSISILTEWKSDVESDVSSIASIKAQSDSNKSSIEELTSWQGTASESLTSVKQQSDANKASIDTITLWQGETTESISEVHQQADDNAASIESLTSWKDDATETISSIEQTTSAHESSISSLTSWQGEAQTSIANVEQKAGANESKINSLTSWQGEASESIANVEQKAADNEAAITSLTTWKGEATESISAIQQTANQNSADISLIASWKSDVEDDVSSIASIKTTADTNKASIEQLVKKDTELSTTIAGVKTTADANEASIDQITAWQDKVNPTINSVAGIKQTADSNAAKIEGLTSWQGETNTAMARVEQKADANGAYIQSTVSNMDKYSVGPHSQAYGFTLEQAKDVLEKGMVYVPTASHGGESFNTNYAFTKTNTYTWSGETWIEDVGKVVFSSTAPSGSAYSLWYTDNDTVTSGYEPYTLYKYGTYETVDDNGNPVTKPHWKPVATLKGNSSNRAVSQIRQDTNSIELSVTTLDDKYAGTKIWVDDNKSAIQDTVKWKGDNAESIATFMQEAGDNFASTSQVAKIVDKDGNINAASIVTAVNGSDSSVVINADHIRFEGFVSFASKDDIKDVQDNAVYNTKVEYALSSSSSEFTAVSGADGQWSVTAPAWQENAYMWQKTTITKGDNSSASTQTCIQGANGTDGNTPYVKNGNWWIGTSDTGVKAEGSDGNTPTVEISNDGYWVINGSKTTVKAIGIDAPTVVSEKKQFYLSTSNTSCVGGSWADSPSGFQYSSNKYMWSRSVYTMSDDSIIEGNPALDKTYTTISNWCMENDETVINGAHIATGTIDAEKINTNAIRSHNYPVDRDGNPIIPSGDDHFSSSGTFLDLSDGAFYSPNFAITSDGDAHFQGNVVAQGGEIAGWDISEQGLTKADANIEVGLSPGNGGTYNDGSDNLGLVLYAGERKTDEIKAMAGTWRFNESSGDQSDFFRFLCDAYLDDTASFSFYGWFNHPTSGWTRYEKASATLAFTYVGDGIITMSLSVDNEKRDLWSYSPDSYGRMEVVDRISDFLLNREIGFGPEGVDDIWIGDYRLSEIFEELATFISGSIGLYPAMLDKDGKLYAQEIRLGGAENSMIDVDRCAVGNLVINNDAIIYKKGWMQDRSLYLGKDGLSVGEGFFVLPSGGCVNANSVRVGVSNNTVQGEVACKILRATQEIIGTVSTSSDRNKKNSIEDLDERYDQFFDALEPQRFKYNNGTSDRYHLGYITQDVQEGLVQAGLTEQEFAGVITIDAGTDAEESYLRYNEFVSLNTDQIQKLKKRVDALEAKNAELEVRLAKLEALLINNAK